MICGSGGHRVTSFVIPFRRIRQVHPAADALRGFERTTISEAMVTQDWAVLWWAFDRHPREADTQRGGSCMLSAHGSFG